MIKTIMIFRFKRLRVEQLNYSSESLDRKELLFIWWNYVTAVLDVDILRPKIDMHV